MLPFAAQLLSFYLTIALVLFLPGYALIYAIWGKKLPFSKLEAFAISFGSSMLITTFLMLVMGKLSISLTSLTISSALILFSSVCLAIFYLRKKKHKIHFEIHLSAFSKIQLITIIILLFLTFFIKTIYLKDTILPSSTDLGHHMYWAKAIAVTGEIPIYEKVDININSSLLSAPAPIADFIIGEHLIFAAIALISKIDFVSYFPALILFLIHMMGIIALFMLTRLIFNSHKNVNAIAISALLFFGPLFALASPQLKFISGGVVGNTIGNFLIPIIIYFLLKALTEKSTSMLSMALFMSFGMVYTHHLSTFVFAFVLFFSVFFFSVFNFKKLIGHIGYWISLFLKPSALTVLFSGILFILFVYTPTYLNTKAVDTAVGSPIKETRTGLTISELTQNAGDIRMALALAGIIMLLASKNRKSYESTIILGWTISLIAISLKPSLFYIDIPSNRVADYIVFPLSIMSGFALIHFFNIFNNSEKNSKHINPNFVLFAFLLLFTLSSTSGMRDNAAALKTDKSPTETLETYAAAKTLAQKTNSQDIILKDHNYLSADSWIKLYFMRGYNYPLSRGYFKRYDDPIKKREQCTNIMISTPNAPEAKECFSATGTDFLMINPEFDSQQFIRIKNFWKVYASDNIEIFFKNK